MDWKDLTAGDQEKARRMAMRALRVYFAEKRWSRLAMGFILIFTGAAGAGASWGLLRFGVGEMWIRYPLATLAAWGVFLALVWAWMQVERRYFTADEQMAALLKGHDPKTAMKRLKEKDSSVLDWFDFPANLDFDDIGGCLIVIIAVVVLGLIFLAVGAIFNVLMAAPVLFAEVFVDAVLIGALYKRVKPLHEQWWVIGAARQTWKPVALTAATLLVFAVIFHFIAPEAKTVGGVIAKLRGKPAQEELLEKPR